MDVFFKTKKLQKICSITKEMVKVLGPGMAKKLKQRMVELNAAEVLADLSHLPPTRLHELKNDRKGQYSVNLEEPYRLLFIPADDPVPLKEEDGGIDIKNVRSVEIIDIEDTHQGKGVKR